MGNKENLALTLKMFSFPELKHSPTMVLALPVKDFRNRLG